MVFDLRPSQSNTDVLAPRIEFGSKEEYFSALERANRDRQKQILPMIYSAGKFIRDHPESEVINRTFVLLAGIFEDPMVENKNLIRLKIVQLAQQCRPFMHLFQSNEKMRLTMLQLGHISDEEARSLSLLLVAAMAAVYAESKHIQHLILEALDSPALVEQWAAVCAVQEFGERSINFCDAVIQKIDVLLFSTHVALEIKVKLLQALSHFKDNSKTVDEVYSLGHKTASHYHAEVSILLASFDLLTKMAVRKGVEGEYIGFLVDRAANYMDDDELLSCVMNSLCTLADYPRWTEKLCEDFLSLNASLIASSSPAAVVSYFQVVCTFLADDRFTDLIYDRYDSFFLLMAYEDDEVAVGAGKVTVECARRHPIRANLDLTDCVLGLLERVLVGDRKLKQAVCNLLFALVCVVPDSEKFRILDKLLAIDSGSKDYDCVLTALNRIVNCEKTLWTRVQAHAGILLAEQLKAYKSDVEMTELGSKPQKRVFKPSDSLVFLILAPDCAAGSKDEETPALIEKFADEMSVDGVYGMAKCALRQGHRTLTVENLLKSLENDAGYAKLDPAWYSALRRFCEARRQLQVENMEEIGNFDSAIECLKKASIDLKTLRTNFKSDLNYSYAQEWILLFTRLVEAINGLVVFFNVNAFYMPKSGGAFTAAYNNHVHNFDTKIRNLFTDIHFFKEQYEERCEEESNKQVALWLQLLTVVKRCTGLFLQAFDPIELPDIAPKSVQNIHLQEVIRWMMTQTSALSRGQRIWLPGIGKAFRLSLIKVIQAAFYLPESFFNLSISNGEQRIESEAQTHSQTETDEPVFKQPKTVFYGNF